MDEIYNKDKLVHLKLMKYGQINENNAFNLFNYIVHNGTWVPCYYALSMTIIFIFLLMFPYGFKWFIIIYLNVKFNLI
jgi:hypothetical protein